MKKTCTTLTVWMALMVGLAACSSPATLSPNQMQTEIAAAVAATQAAQQLSPVLTSTPAATNTQEPTNTPAATSTPKPTNTPRPTATPDQGTIKSPFPFGEEVSLYRESFGQRSDWSLQVQDVIRGDEADTIVRRANQFNDEPPAGASWMLIKVKVTLLKGAAFTLDATDIAVISGGQIFAGVEFGVCCTEDNGYPELDANIALPGTSVEGWVIRPVLLNDEKPLLALNIDEYQPNLDDGLFFDLSR
jgi:hypothetical protein